MGGGLFGIVGAQPRSQSRKEDGIRMNLDRAATRYVQCREGAAAEILV